MAAESQNFSGQRGQLYQQSTLAVVESGAELRRGVKRLASLEALMGRKGLKGDPF